MGGVNLELQIERIESLQAELQHMLQDDALAHLEARTAELGSRINTVLAACQSAPQQPHPFAAQLERISLTQRNLVELVQRKVQATGTQVARAKASRAAALRYAVEPARIEVNLKPNTDISG
jgi:hypothetical protein